MDPLADYSKLKDVGNVGMSDGRGFYTVVMNHCRSRTLYPFRTNGLLTCTDRQRPASSTGCGCFVKRELELLFHCQEAYRLLKHVAQPEWFDEAVVG